MNKVQSLTRSLVRQKLALLIFALLLGTCFVFQTASAIEIPGDIDRDGDGIYDSLDNCVNLANADQSDVDGDGIGNVCDNCANLANVTQADADNDHLGDSCDNCASVANSDQADDDCDHLGNACDNYMCRATGKEVCGDSLDNDCDGLTDNGCADITAPTGYFSDLASNAEISGLNLVINVTTADSESLVKDVCLQYGTSTPANSIKCLTLSERDGNSYNYAASFNFTWDTTAVSDGQNNLYAVLTDNTGNIATLTLPVIINNYGPGTLGNPAPITNCQELQDIDQHMIWHYELKNDIDCADSKNWNSGHGLLPIGGSSSSFTGSLQGNNFSIFDLYQNVSDNSGVFNTLGTGAKISGVNFRRADIRCGSQYCGGITNLNFGTIDQSSIVGKLQCTGKCGGFASQNSGLISQSWADMTIGEGGYAGLIAGQNYDGLIEDSYTKGRVTTYQGGGLVGLNEHWISGGMITNSYSTVQVSDYSGNGGLIGWQYAGGSQSGSYWDKDTSGYTRMCGSDAGGTNCDNTHGLTDVEMKSQPSFVGWDFESIWAINESLNDGYPYLRWQTSFTEADKTAPVITLSGNTIVNVMVGNDYQDAGATALDNVDGDLTKAMVTKNPISSSSPIGAYSVAYNVKDDAGNIAKTVTRTINIVAKEEKKNGNQGGGGSGGSAPACASVFYGPWGDCVNQVIQYRDVLIQEPAICSMTAAQQLARAQACSSQLGGEDERLGFQTLSKPGLASSTPIKKVLGTQTFRNGTLVRSRTNPRIYIIVNGRKVHIRTLKELFKYIGQPILAID